MKGRTIILVLGLMLVVAAGFVGGPLLWRFAIPRVRPVVHAAEAVLDARNVTQDNRGAFTNIIFLHHSTGHNLMAQGEVKAGFAELGYDLWDHGYNAEGLRRSDWSPTGYSYNVPHDNTNPDGLAAIFSQRVYDLPVNTLSGLLQHEVIIFKSCFPVSHITDEAQLEQYEAYYLDMRDVMGAYPERIFIVMTPPPLNPAATNADAAVRARAFANWLTSDAYLGTYPNIFTFDFFDHLAEDDPTASDYSMLRERYREGGDSHPNQVANEEIGPQFVDFVVRSIESYRAGK